MEQELSNTHSLNYNCQHVHYIERMKEMFDDRNTACESSTDDGLKEGALLRSSSTKWQLDVFVLIKGEGRDFADTHALIDSGCTHSCIDKEFVRRYDIPTK